MTADVISMALRRLSGEGDEGQARPASSVIASPTGPAFGHPMAGSGEAIQLFVRGPWIASSLRSSQ
jgi:hypothetical protein